MSPVLGPCPCQGCGQFVYWYWFIHREFGAWRDKNGLAHRCATRRAA